jgi:hypothetical protein
MLDIQAELVHSYLKELEEQEISEKHRTIIKNLFAKKKFTSE